MSTSRSLEWDFTSSETATFESTDYTFVTMRPTGSVQLVAGGLKVDSYNNISFVDINDFHESYGSFSIDFTVTEHNTDITKSANYITFGYHVRGQEGGAITVGRPAGLSYPVIGVIGSEKTTASHKGTNIQAGPNMISNQTKNFILSYNSLVDGPSALQLHEINDGLICDASGLEQYNLLPSDLKLFIGSSGWNNEESWNGIFDLADITVSNLVFNSLKPTLPSSLLGSSVSVVDVLSTGKVFGTTGDSINVRFTSTIITIVENIKVYIMDESFTTEIDSLTNISGDGSVSTPWNFESTITASYPEGKVFIRIDYFGTVFDETVSTFYVTRSPPIALEYNIISNTNTSISFQISKIYDPIIFTGNYESVDYTGVTGVTQLSGWIVNFAAADQNSNISQTNTEELTITNTGDVVSSGTYVITGLLDSTTYTVTGSVTSPASVDTLSGISALSGTNLVRTKDAVLPFIAAIDGVEGTAVTSVDGYLNIQINVYATDENSQFEVYAAIFDSVLSGQSDANIISFMTSSISSLIQVKRDPSSSPIQITYDQDSFYTYGNTVPKKLVPSTNSYYIYVVVKDYPVDASGNEYDSNSILGNPVEIAVTPTLVSTSLTSDRV